MADGLISLKEALAKYDRQADNDAVIGAENERMEVLKRFPIDEWPNLPLGSYALGQSNMDCYCWWLEFGTSRIGSIRGGNARKHIIYKRNDGNWYYPKKFQSVDQAWQSLRTSFCDAFTAAKANDWEKVDEITAPAIGPALSAKTLYCYFPEEILPISSITHLRHFLGLIATERTNDSGYDIVRLNRELLHSLRQRPEFKNWKTKELERFLYWWADPRDQRRAVKIAPGENAKFWDECFEGGYIRLGWGRTGDLRSFESKDTFRAKFAETYGEGYKHHQPIISKKAKEVWTLRELAPGDIVIANQGTSRILAVGEVIEPGYDWTEHNGHDDDFNHIVHVNWDTDYKQDIPPQKAWAMVTVAPVSQTLLSQIMGKSKDASYSKGMAGAGKVEGSGDSNIPIDPLFREIAGSMERKGQAILYGPPGTGKTFAARRFAVWWLARKSGDVSAESLLGDSEAFSAAEQKLSTAQVARKVWWIVANPKEWNWDRLFKEKCVEYRYGRLQRNYPLVREGDLVVGYQSAPDKRIVALARISKGMHPAKDGSPVIELEPISRIDDGLTFEDLQNDATLLASEPLRFRCQGTLFALTEDEFDHLAALLTERNPDLRRHLEGSVAGVGPLTRLTFHASYSYEDFVEGFRPVDSKDGHLALRLEDGIFKRVCREAQANPDKHYLVMIDEINRANVAKVFGELITLLEKDKRGIPVSLPQSKEAFAIPPNVYVLGTMNTADRSIKLLDAALRRRFAFIELMPDSTLLTGGKVGNLALDEFLDELNRRIAAKEGREKQIGHSFLMDGGIPISDPEEFARCFRQDILPLLQEYCYEDYRLLAGYIGDKLVDKDAQMLDEECLTDPEELIQALESAFAKQAEYP